MADEIRAHLVELILAEQREHEQQTGHKAKPIGRKRPAAKKTKE